MNGYSSSALAEDRDIVWITTEVADVVPNPLQGKHHVLHGVVAGGMPVTGAQESQDAQSVVQGNVDDVLGNKEVGSVHAVIATAQDESSTMDPDHNGTRTDDGLRIDVQGQAVLLPHFIADNSATGTVRSVLAGIADSSPASMGYGVTESQVPGRGLSKGDSLPGKVTITEQASALLNTASLPTGRIDHQVIEQGGRVQMGHGPKNDDQNG